MIPEPSYSPFFTNATLEQLTQDFPVKQVLGGWYGLLRIPGVFHPNYGAGVFSGSPANNLEAEILFGDLVRKAAVEDKWVGKRMHLKNAVNSIRENLRDAEENGLVNLGPEVVLGGYEISPTRVFIVYVNSRLRQITPDNFSSVSPFTRRQYEILRVVSRLDYQCGTLKQASKIIGINSRTVSLHVTNILAKLQSPDLASAVYFSLERGYLSPTPDIVRRLQDLRTGYDSLTKAQRNVFSAFADCLSEKTSPSGEAIAQKLSVSRKNVEEHKRNVYHKLGISNKVQFAIVAYYLNI